MGGIFYHFSTREISTRAQGASWEVASSAIDPDSRADRQPIVPFVEFNDL